jgi:hypothetical protein
MDHLGRIYEQFKVAGKDLADKIREIIHEGNVRRIIIKDEQGHTFMEIPLTVATIGVVLAPVLAAVGAIAALVAKVEVVVERSAEPAPGPASPGSPVTDPASGATEDQVNMAGAAPQHMDDKGTRAEDVAGTGEHDALGG